MYSHRRARFFGPDMAAREVKAVQASLLFTFAAPARFGTAEGMSRDNRDNGQSERAHPEEVRTIAEGV
jgi:hypothetical protein